MDTDTVHTDLALPDILDRFIGRIILDKDLLKFVTFPVEGAGGNELNIEAL